MAWSLLYRNRDTGQWRLAWWVGPAETHEQFAQLQEHIAADEEFRRMVVETTAVKPTLMLLNGE